MINLSHKMNEIGEARGKGPWGISKSTSSSSFDGTFDGHKMIHPIRATYILECMNPRIQKPWAKHEHNKNHTHSWTYSELNRTINIFYSLMTEWAFERDQIKNTCTKPHQKNVCIYPYQVLNLLNTLLRLLLSLSLLLIFKYSSHAHTSVTQTHSHIMCQ